MAAEKMTFEESLAKLEEIVEAIETGQVPLEESIAKYADGIKLIKQCRSILDRAEKKVEILVGKQGGGRKLEPFGGAAPNSADEE